MQLLDDHMELQSDADMEEIQEIINEEEIAENNVESQSNMRIKRGSRYTQHR